ncbi:MAG: translocation/assembly module TamB domain-containing protein [Cyanobacteria bacterium]|nr:translocation/assembly module TamB domain-containing protein [Cyanobacteriota bacterium]
MSLLPRHWFRSLRSLWPAKAAGPWKPGWLALPVWSAKLPWIGRPAASAQPPAAGPDDLGAGPNPGGDARGPIRRPRTAATALAAGGVLVAGAAALWLASDRILAGLYESWRPRLERQVGTLMGRPLQLGPYCGFSADGLCVGPSRFLAGPRDGSTVEVRRGHVLLDPLASWRRRSLVLDISFSDARVDLRPNARGQWWVLGQAQAGGKPPRLDLRFRLLQPGRLRIWGLGQGGQPIEIDAAGQVGLWPHQRKIEGRARLELPGQAGAALLVGSGQWQQRSWRLQISPQHLAINSLGRFVPLKGQLSGAADGMVSLNLEQAKASCQGQVLLSAMRWRQAGVAQPLALDTVPLSCRSQRLTMAPSLWRFGAWAGQASGRIDTDRSLSLRLLARPPVAQRLGSDPIQASLEGRWQAGHLQQARLQAWRGQSRLALTGAIGRQLDLAGAWRLDPVDLPRGRQLPDWLRDRPLEGRLLATGLLRQPDLQLDTVLQHSNPVLGSWQASLRLAAGQLQLRRLSAEHLQASASLPLLIESGRGMRLGELQADFNLSDFPLARLSRLVGTPLQGRLDAQGRVHGALGALVPDLDLVVRGPGAGPLRLEETWAGRLNGLSAGGGQLRVAARTPAPSGTITAQLDRRWRPTAIAMQRDGGSLQLSGNPARYQWQARDLPLHGLSLALGRNRPFQPLDGALSGSGHLGLQPLAFGGDVALDHPQFLGLGGRRVQARVAYADRQYSLTGQVEPLASGSIDVALKGRWAGPFEARFQATDLSSLLFNQILQAWAVWRGAPLPRRAGAADLALEAIDTQGASIDETLLVLRQVQERLNALDEQRRRATRAERLSRLQMRLDADLAIRGPDLRRARADLKAKGHLWLALRDRDLSLAQDPFQVRLEGALFAGDGSFDVSGVSLALLALLTPVPESLRGHLGLRGRYRLGSGRPEVAMDLTLDDGALAQRALRLDRGHLELKAKGLGVDLALRADGASSSVDLAGTIPLELGSDNLELRLASRGDGLRFLTDLTGRAVTWRKGSVDLQLLVRGSLTAPIANGFLRFRDGEYELVGQSLRGVEATVLFDFEQLLVQDLKASVGKRGQIRGEGRLGLLHPLSPGPTLALTLQEVPFAQSRIAAIAAGQLTLAGSLVAPKLGGQLAISNGTINAQPGQLGRPEAPGAAAGPNGSRAAIAGGRVQPTSMNELLQRRWDFSQPLVLLGPDVESATNAGLQESIPNLPWLSFDNLQLRFGPGLRVVLPNIANFSTGGALRINGRLDPSLRASGVVRLLKGRLNLFTTTFSLDPDAPNVAVFTPSLGLVPYLDIALRTRIADSLNVISPSGLGQGGLGNAGTPQLGVDPQGGFSSLNQLNLILVTVSVSGPADRIAENIRLRSSPPLPQERLVALIGGNSLAGLSGAQAGTALATVLGQSLLSPLLATFSDALGQRVSLALYPTYVNPSIADRSAIRSGRVPPLLVLATEMGYDITDRLNASLLLAPNRSDVAPQVTLSYKASETFNVQTSVDSQGAWQSLLQLFFRF